MKMAIWFSGAIRKLEDDCFPGYMFLGKNIEQWKNENHQIKMRLA
jgi:hypothetical protein